MSRKIISLPPNARTIILGVGNELRGDDAAGSTIIKKLNEEEIDPTETLLINAGAVPENFTSKIKKFNPTHLIIIDAVEFGGKPGEITQVDIEKIEEQKTSTHRLPLSMLVDFLRSQINAEITVIGIQPAQIEMNAEMTSEVEKSVKKLTKVILEEIRK